MEEIWLPVKNYEGLYEVSNLGNVRSFHFHRGSYQRILKPRKVKDGYLMVALYKNKHCRNFQVHHLVGEAFLRNPYNLNELNHKDGNKTNNKASNLEWITHIENVHHYHKILKEFKNV